MTRLSGPFFESIRPASAFASRLDIHAFAVIIFLASIFLPDGERYALFISLGLVLPLAVLGSFSPKRPTMGFSTVLAACGLYLAAMMASSLIGSGATWHLLRHQGRASVMILVFLIIVALITDRRLSRRLFFWVGLVVSISAALNIYLYFRNIAPPAGLPLSAYRLLTSVGMRDYANSTNISATYAVFLVGTFAVLADRGQSLLRRAVLTGAAIILFGALALTQSRSGLAGALVGMLAVVVTASPRVRIISFVAVVAVVVAAFFTPAVNEAILERGSSHRFEVWQKFLPLVERHPFMGYGAYSPVGITLDEGTFLDQAHNLIFSGWFRAGITGAVAMAYILLGGLFWSARYWWATRDIVPFSVLATIATAGMFDYQLMVTYPSWPWVTFWLPFGLAIGAERAWGRARGNGMVSGQEAFVPTSGHHSGNIEVGSRV